MAQGGLCQSKQVEIRPGAKASIFDLVLAKPSRKLYRKIVPSPKFNSWEKSSAIGARTSPYGFNMVSDVVSPKPSRISEPDPEVNFRLGLNGINILSRAW